MIENINEYYLTSLNKLASNFNIIVQKEDLKKENDYYVGYFEKDKLVAFINYSLYYERAEINYIFVLEKYRRKNIATNLFNHILNKNKELKNITLEVRESNETAIHFYEKCGFRKCTIRKNYYGNENALLMIKECGDENE